MGGAQFGLLDGLLLLALQGIACFAALRIVDSTNLPGQALRWLGLTLASYSAAFVIHIIAFALLGQMLPEENLRPVRRLIVALVWALACGTTAFLLARRWRAASVPAPALSLHTALCSALAYGLFIVSAELRAD